MLSKGPQSLRRLYPTIMANGHRVDVVVSIVISMAATTRVAADKTTIAEMMGETNAGGTITDKNEFYLKSLIEWNQ